MHAGLQVSLHAAVTVCASLVDTQTDNFLTSYTTSSASQVC